MKVALKERMYNPKTFHTIFLPKNYKVTLKLAFENIIFLYFTIFQSSIRSWRGEYLWDTLYFDTLNTYSYIESSFIAVVTVEMLENET